MDDYKAFLDLARDEQKYYQGMLDEIMLIGSAEEKRLAAICPEKLRQIHRYGSYYFFSLDDPPNLNRLRRFIQQIIHGNLEQKYEQNLRFIEEHGMEFTTRMVDKLDESGLYWKEFPDDDFLPYLYQDILQCCIKYELLS